MSNGAEAASPGVQEGPTIRHLARTVFTVFLLTFIASRVLVILIMERKAPDFFLHLGGTHVHHLNYGIFILSALGAVLLFVPLNPLQRWWCAVAYGFGMALTFDEFGMWLHLGGGYWQRASFDAVIVILGLLGMLGFAPSPQRMRAHHWITALGTILVTILFYALLFKSLNYADRKEGARWQQLEQNGPQ
jgi:DMSO/TMAO reductase YedYZ heme-binding membrane subunit